MQAACLGFLGTKGTKMAQNGPDREYDIHEDERIESGLRAPSPSLVVKDPFKKSGMEKTEQTYIRLRVSPEDEEALDAYCKETGATRATALRMALKAFLKQQGFDSRTAVLAVMRREGQ